MELIHIPIARYRPPVYVRQLSEGLLIWAISSADNCRLDTPHTLSQNSERLRAPVAVVLHTLRTA